jgi:branched-chain amino acid transport system permease protein
MFYLGNILSKRSRIYIMATGIFVIVWVVLPPLLNPYWINVFIETLIYGLYAMGLSILVGYMGFPSLGQAAFFGTGAYTLGISSVRLGQGQGMSFLIAMTVVFLVAAVLGMLVFRTRGIYFLFITLGLAQILWAIAWKWHSVTGGDDGLVGIMRPNLGLSWWDLSSDTSFYYFILIIFVLAFFALLLITRSPLGRSLVGIRESEVRMRCLGYNVFLHKYLAFIISGLFSGLAGILFAWHNLFVATTQLNIALSADGLFMVILGGGTIWGTFLGSTIIVFLIHIASMLTAHWLFIMGAFYIAIIIYMPHGVSAILKGR